MSSESQTFKKKTREEIALAYKSEPWWYDLRGFFILTFAYRLSLFALLRFFVGNFGKRHLEVAVGSGTMLEMILRLRKWMGLPEVDIVGVDYAESMLAGAMHRFSKNPRIELHLADVAQMDFPDAFFDSVNIANAVHCFPDVDAGFREVYRVLKPGRLLVANVLLPPRSGSPFFLDLAKRINEWGVKKGILYSTLEKDDLCQRLAAAGFTIVSDEIAGNCCHIVASKPDPVRVEDLDYEFDYSTAFESNIGWLSRQEQERLRNSCVAIAGVGGEGFQVLSMARLGVGNFKIADPDVYELKNFNRQAGATVGTIGQPKVHVMADMIRAVNPEAQVDMVEDKIGPHNVDAFLEGADIVIDGIDFFEIDAKILLYNRARAKGLVVISSCPLGFGASLLVFAPDGMSFEDYFDLKPNMGYKEKIAAVLLGLNPLPFALDYIGKNVGGNMDKRIGPSVCPGVMMMSALISTEAVKILAGKGRIRYIPHFYHIDAFSQKVNNKTYPFGMRSPLQKFKRFIIAQYFLKG